MIALFVKNYYTYLSCLLSVFTCYFSSLIGGSSGHKTNIGKYLQPIQITESNPNIKRVDCIYVINLDKRVEKWNRMQRILREVRLNANRVSAINGWEISLETKKKLAGPYPLRLRGGQIGCLLSHLSVVQDAYNRKFKAIWVMEDDIEFLEDPNILSQYIQDLSQRDPKWDILYTDRDIRTAPNEYMKSDYYDPRPNQKLPSRQSLLRRVPISSDLMRVYQRYGTHSMIISRRGMRKILSYYNSLYLWVPIDADLHYIPTIRQYAAIRDIVSNTFYNFANSDTASCDFYLMTSVSDTPN